MKPLKTSVILISIVMLSNGCAHVDFPAFQQDKKKAQAEQMAKKPKPPIVIRVSGYSAYDQEHGAHRRIEALKASKYDAYRALAERIYGVSLESHAQIDADGHFNQTLSAYSHTVLRGARLVSVIENEDGIVETVMEVVLDSRFDECIATNHQIKLSSECRMALPKQAMPQSQAKSAPRLYQVN